MPYSLRTVFCCTPALFQALLTSQTLFGFALFEKAAAFPVTRMALAHGGCWWSSSIEIT
jgi:hypothetical protein